MNVTLPIHVTYHYKKPHATTEQTGSRIQTQKRNIKNNAVLGYNQQNFFLSHVRAGNVCVFNASSGGRRWRLKRPRLPGRCAWMNRAQRCALAAHTCARGARRGCTPPHLQNPPGKTARALGGIKKSWIKQPDLLRTGFGATLACSLQRVSASANVPAPAKRAKTLRLKAQTSSVPGFMVNCANGFASSSTGAAGATH